MKKGKCFLQMLESKEEVLTDIYEEEIKLQLDIEIPNDITWDNFFDSSLEYNAFKIGISELLGKVANSIQCEDCRCSLTSPYGDENSGNRLKRLRGNELREPTFFVNRFFLQLEFIFVRLQQENDENGLADNFIEIVNNRVTTNIFHCQTTAKKLSKSFFKYRVGLAKCRNIHRRNKFASKSLN